MGQSPGAILGTSNFGGPEGTPILDFGFATAPAEIQDPKPKIQNPKRTAQRIVKRRGFICCSLLLPSATTRGGQPRVAAPRRTAAVDPNPNRTRYPAPESETAPDCPALI